jgi:hypothetical protein
MTTAKEYAKLSDSEKKKEDWMNAKWRPMMGWIYMLTCVTDFILFPVLWSILQAAMHQPVTAWQPITLQGAGLFHLSMGAIIGVAAFGRTQEKLAGANNGGMQPVGQSVTTTYGSPSAGGFGASSSFGAPASNSFGGGGFGSTSSPSDFGSPSRPATGKAAKFADPNPDSVFDRG